MKKIILTVTLVTLTFSFTTAQKTAPIKQLEVTPKTIASQAAGKPLLIDLTRTGTVYKVAGDIDYSRVRVRLSTGEMAMSDLARKLGMTGSKFLLGTFSDLSALDFGLRPGGGTFQPPDGGTSPARWSCHDLVCTCTGKPDCRKMGIADVCLTGTVGCAKIPGKPAGCACLDKTYY